jgi:glycosyltransferase involved in cell wall biosynthesis
MRIGLLSPIRSAVPPDGYGGVESVVAVLADGLVEAGHDVTLFATADSKTRAKLVSLLDEPPKEPGRLADAEVEHAVECLAHASELDLISGHLGVLGATLCGASATPSVHSVSDPVDRTGPIWERIAAVWPRTRLVSTSLRQQELAPELPWIGNCYNGLDLDRYPFADEPGTYLAFLGRMSPDKGCLEVIEVARAAGLPLRIAAKLEEPHEREYFGRCIEPELGDGVEYLGELAHEQKVELLGGASATLLPVDVEEAFGLVLIESMACGTPPIATREGAVPEIVDDGHTGILVDDVPRMAEAVRRVGEIDRHTCRENVEKRFSAEQLVETYEHAFEALLSQA